jgi:hypothetical protein
LRGYTRKARDGLADQRSTKFSASADVAERPSGGWEHEAARCFENRGSRVESDVVVRRWEGGEIREGR